MLPAEVLTCRSMSRLLDRRFCFSAVSLSACLIKSSTSSFQSCNKMPQPDISFYTDCHISQVDLLCSPGSSACGLSQQSTNTAISHQDASRLWHPCGHQNLLLHRQRLFLRPSALHRLTTSTRFLWRRGYWHALVTCSICPCRVKTSSSSRAFSAVVSASALLSRAMSARCRVMQADRSFVSLFAPCNLHRFALMHLCLYSVHHARSIRYDHMQTTVLCCRACNRTCIALWHSMRSPVHPDNAALT